MKMKRKLTLIWLTVMLLWASPHWMVSQTSDVRDVYQELGLQPFYMGMTYQQWKEKLNDRYIYIQDCELVYEEIDFNPYIRLFSAYNYQLFEKWLISNWNHHVFLEIWDMPIQSQYGELCFNDKGKHQLKFHEIKHFQMPKKYLCEFDDRIIDLSFLFFQNRLIQIDFQVNLDVEQIIKFFHYYENLYGASKQERIIPPPDPRETYEIKEYPLEFFWIQKNLRLSMIMTPETEKALSNVYASWANDTFNNHILDLSIKDTESIKQMKIYKERTEKDILSQLSHQMEQTERLIGNYLEREPEIQAQKKLEIERY